MNPEFRLGRHLSAAALAVVALVALGWAGRSHVYQRGLLLDYLRWQVWAAPRGEAEAHLRLELAIEKVTADPRSNGNLTPVIPELLSLTRDYPDSEFTARAWELLFGHYRLRREYGRASDCMNAVLRMQESPRFDARAWHGKALFNLGEVYRQTKDLNGAEGYYRRVVAQYPERREQALEALSFLDRERRQTGPPVRPGRRER